MTKMDFNIVLIGFMGAGKSTVASGLNRLYGMQIVEMDECIAKREGKVSRKFSRPTGKNIFGIWRQNF